MQAGWASSSSTRCMCVCEQAGTCRNQFGGLCSQRTVVQRKGQACAKKELDWLPARASCCSKTFHIITPAPSLSRRSNLQHMMPSKMTEMAELHPAGACEVAEMSRPRHIMVAWAYLFSITTNASFKRSSSEPSVGLRVREWQDRQFRSPGRGTRPSRFRPASSTVGTCSWKMFDEIPTEILPLCRPIIA